MKKNNNSSKKIFHKRTTSQFVLGTVATFITAVTGLLPDQVLSQENTQNNSEQTTVKA